MYLPFRAQNIFKHTQASVSLLPGLTNAWLSALTINNYLFNINEILRYPCDRFTIHFLEELFNNLLITLLSNHKFILAKLLIFQVVKNPFLEFFFHLRDHRSEIPQGLPYSLRKYRLL
jgi:hypothetical protein